jgi:predicted DNA-binding antitoxin AbrB/MazE fold protein
MTLTIDAIYEKGLLKPKNPLTLPEGAEVHLIITPVNSDTDPLDGVIGIGESGRSDGAETHDKYLYGKRQQ